MRPNNVHEKTPRPLQSQTKTPLSMSWLQQTVKLRPQFLAYDGVTSSVLHRMIWTPLSATVQQVQRARMQGLLEHEQEHQYRHELYGQLTQYAQRYGTSSAYDFILPAIAGQYAQVAKNSLTGSLISEHSQSMMDTFRRSQSSVLPSFSLSLVHNSVQRIPAPLPDTASWLEQCLHSWKSVKGYTLAHNDAYKDLGIDRHFTPAWLTSFVILGKGATSGFSSLLPKSYYSPISELYGAFTGKMALTFNPAQQYDSSDFTKRTLLYAGMSYPLFRQAIPRLFVATAKVGPMQLRIVNVCASLLLGGGYEFGCGYQHGTGFMKRAVNYFTFVDKDE